MQYDFNRIEPKWREEWRKRQTYKVTEDPEREKFYVLDMFPYPSGAGLHVGHPLGYIASDIYSRYMMARGYNVLHPMGYDAFGLPAEQYAIQTGQHPAVTTANNIKKYREQLDQIGFCFDWSREVRTSDPSYYQWTQWIFKQLFHSWYDQATDQAEPIETLIEGFEQKGSEGVQAACDEHAPFTAEEWREMSEARQQKILLHYRLAFLSDQWVNWCPKLGTVLANEEVQDGLSERGGYPVERKLMKQWSLRITAYADRLLEGLGRIDWSNSLKEQQRNWIGRSEGASVRFSIQNSDKELEAFTTRPDTIFGVTFMVLAPEHEWVEELTTPEQQEAVKVCMEKASRRSERERMAEDENIIGAFTGAYAVHPLTGDQVPIWIGDYVLATYGTGAVMAVPASDERDWKFARHFGLDIVPVIEGTDIEKGANPGKEGKMINSGFLNGMPVVEAIPEAIRKLEEAGKGTGKVNYRLRDAIFSRQRYWGEPFPVYYREMEGEEIPYTLSDDQLPLELPEVDRYKPTEEGEPPLARAKNWKTEEGYRLEYNTMPGWAGSSWYFLRYMDPDNDQAFVARDKVEHWQNVDLYIGGSEHATGHLLYSRFWTKFLYDRGYLPFDEPFRKLINQGMIVGTSYRVYYDPERKLAVSADAVEKGKALQGGKKPEDHGVDLKALRETFAHIDLIAGESMLDVEGFREWSPEYQDHEFLTNEEGIFECATQTDKMSKSKFNVVNPDDLIEKYGADTLRLYEMFLGPLEQMKPWDTNGIEGVHRFLKRLWGLFHEEERFRVSEEEPEEKELKVLHQCIHRVRGDLDRYSFNTVVSHFMVGVNELRELNCCKRQVLEPFVVLVAPYAPHIAEELWEKLGYEASILKAPYPEAEERYLKESAVTYPVSFNGKRRFEIELPTDLSKEAVEKEVMAHEKTAHYLQGKTPKKVIVVPQKIVNVVV